MVTASEWTAGVEPRSPCRDTDRKPLVASFPRNSTPGVVADYDIFSRLRGDWRGGASPVTLTAALVVAVCFWCHPVRSAVLHQFLALQKPHQGCVNVVGMGVLYFVARQRIFPEELGNILGF